MSPYRILGRKKIWWFVISTVIMIPAVVALIGWKLPLGIDFRGGSRLDLKFDKPVGESQLRDKASTYPGVSGLVVTKADQTKFTLKMLPISDSDHKTVLTKLKKDFGQVAEQQYQLVGPSISQDLTRKAVIAVILASILIVLYLAYSFRGLKAPSSPWRFGVTALVALLHDLLITAGVFAIFAHFFHYEVDASFITALLTVMGFSVHDTIVVFDRVRENASHAPEAVEADFEQVADESLRQTLNRSLATSLTVIFTLTSLTILGGETIRPFVLTLLIGIVVGTYSSIFTATPLLVVWQQRVSRRSQRGS